MKVLISMLFSMLFPFSVNAQGFRDCATWDTFCKSAPQIVATKCRLGVPVEQSTCDLLGYGHYSTMSGGLVPGLPVSELEFGVTTNEILKDYL